MAKRNIYQTIKDACIKPAYDMTMDELNELTNKAKQDKAIEDAIYNAFKYGYVMGQRATIKDVQNGDISITKYEQGERKNVSMFLDV